MEMMHFSILVLSIKKRAPVFWKRFLFSRKSFSKFKYWKPLKFSVIATWKHADPPNGGLFWKSLVPFFTRTYALSVGFKMKPLRKRFSSVKKNQPKFCCKTCCKEQPFTFTVYFMTHIFQTSVFLIRDNEMYNRT